MKFARRASRYLFDRVVNAPRGRGKPIAVEAWDRDYRTGNWGHLKNISEMAHYAIIRGYILGLTHKSRILDVGCGEGILCGYLQSVPITTYVGLDISSAAVEKANRKGFPCSRFMVADFNLPPKLDKFDVIIFNESIYYALDPVMAFECSLHSLEDAGLVIISMHHTGIRTSAIWRRLERRWPSSYATRISNECGQRWDVRVFANDIVQRAIVDEMKTASSA